LLLGNIQYMIYVGSIYRCTRIGLRTTTEPIVIMIATGPATTTMIERTTGHVTTDTTDCGKTTHATSEDA